MNWDRIFLWLVGIALAGLLVGAWRNRAPLSSAETMSGKVDVSNTPENSDASEGRAYLMANQSPWAFAPPVNNYLPGMVAGGQSVLIQPPPGQGKYGCFEC